MEQIGEIFLGLAIFLGLSISIVFFFVEGIRDIRLSRGEMGENTLGEGIMEIGAGITFIFLMIGFLITMFA